MWVRVSLLPWFTHSLHLHLHFVSGVFEKLINAFLHLLNKPYAIVFETSSYTFFWNFDSEVIFFLVTLAERAFILIRLLYTLSLKYTIGKVYNCKFSLVYLVSRRYKGVCVCENTFCHFLKTIISHLKNISEAFNKTRKVKNYNNFSVIYNNVRFIFGSMYVNVRGDWCLKPDQLQILL